MFNEKDLQIRDFAINKDYGLDEPFFRVITEYGEVQLPKLQFQLNQPLPDTLSCRIKGFNGQQLMLGHNMPRYVSEFYADGFSKGQEFEFKVINVQEGQKGFYRLADDNGLTFKLHEPKVTLVRGQSVKCRFEVMTHDYFTLRRSASDAQLAMRNLNDFVRAAKVHGLNVPILDNLLRQIPELSEALDQLSHGRPIWVMTAIRAIRPIMPRIFRTAIETSDHDKVLDIIKGYERVLLSLLQGSGFLRNVKGSERTSLQAELTAQIEQLDIYQRTLYIISNGEQHKFIDNLLQNLKESGYIYHPTTQFSIMMILFRMKPELVNSSLGNIFDTLMGWDPETWKTEPFRQAFVEQLEIYISETREEIDRFLQAETAADNEMIEKMLTAIAIQQSLANKNDTVDIRLNTSLFYRYLSLLRTTKAQVLLCKSYLALMGVKLPIDYTWSDIKEPTMMMTRASVDPPANAVLPPDCRYYISDNLEVEVGPEGIALGKIGTDSQNAVPNGWLPWPGHGLKVYADCTIKPQKMKTMEGHAEFWSMIETDLFMPEAVDNGVVATKRMADIGDNVVIVVDRVINSATDHFRSEAFECHIVDDHYIEARGLLPAENIVNYNLHGVTDGTFRHDNGEHMLFEAQVVDIDDNDRLVFSLLDSTRQAIRDMANAGEKCYCVVTKDNGRSYSAISEKGFGLYVNKEHDGTPSFHRGNVLRVTITGTTNDAIQSVVDEGPIDNHPFYNNRALHNLLLRIALAGGDSADSDMDFDDDEMMPREDMREIVEILRYKAVSARDNIIMAFDYLSYARLLALIIGDEALASTIKAHKDLLLLHQHYAKNKSIYLEDIERAIDLAPESTLIQRLGARLRIVSALGHAEENANLWNIANTSTNDLEKELSQMVLSHNMLYAINHDDHAVHAIKDRIAQKLNVDSSQRSLKYYGSESQYVEFKSSLVYPAQKGRSGLSLADPDKQEFEILHIIAGMLNTHGGTLYIGVNDEHYECGLADDFSFYRMDQSERNTKWRRSIKTLDNLANYLQNLIDSAFNLGKNAGEYAKTGIDDESEKGVVYVKIEPCPHVVKLDGNIYVRHGSKTEPLVRPAEIDLFVADREHLYRQLMGANAQPVEAEADAAAPAAPAAAEAKAEAPVVEDADMSHHFSVGTSRVRKNVLHDYEDPDHFVTPKMYIRFVEDNKYVITKDEWSIDTDTDRLVLAITEEELDDYLVMVYEDEYVLKVRVRDLAERISNSPKKHHTEHPLRFATIVPQGGGLYSMYYNSKQTLYERVTPIERILQGSMATAPERILEADGITPVMYEVVRAAKMPEFAPLLSTSMKRAQVGALVKGTSTIKTTPAEAERQALGRLQ